MQAQTAEISVKLGFSLLQAEESSPVDVGIPVLGRCLLYFPQARRHFTQLELFCNNRSYCAQKAANRENYDIIVRGVWGFLARVLGHGTTTGTLVKCLGLRVMSPCKKFATEPAKPDDEPKHERATILLEPARYLALGQDLGSRALEASPTPPTPSSARGPACGAHLRRTITFLSFRLPPAGSRRIAAHPRPRPRATDERTIDWNSLKHDISPGGSPGEKIVCRPVPASAAPSSPAKPLPQMLSSS